MIILQDSREQNPYTFSDERYKGVIVERTTLPLADYSISGYQDRVGIERKSLDDLISCLMGSNRDRFERELSKLQFYELPAVLIEASLEDVKCGRYRSEMKSHAAMQSIIAFQVRYRIPFIWAGSRKAAEYICWSMLTKFVEEIEKRYRHLKKSQAQKG